VFSAAPPPRSIFGFAILALRCSNLVGVNGFVRSPYAPILSASYSLSIEGDASPSDGRP